MIKSEDLKNGEEQYQDFISKISRMMFTQYDYRDIDGELFSCVAKDIYKCREKKDSWLEQKYSKN